MGPGRRAPGAVPAGSMSRDTGAAALEFALVAPLLFVFLFGIFAAGWGLWEHQAARASARAAARLAAIGIPDATGYKKAVICLGERNGMPRGSLAEIAVGFRDAPTDLTKPATTVGAGDYVVVTLKYTSAVRHLPFTDWTLTDAQGRFSSVAVTRVEQVPLSGVVADQTITVANETCT